MKLRLKLHKVDSDGQFIFYMSRNYHKKKKFIIVVTSGGFDPIHIGHIRLIQAAKKLGDKLVIILNNDNWLKAKKGYVFMPEQERKEILLAIKGVDRVVITAHKPNDKDRSVVRELKLVRPHIFANGGDASMKAPNAGPEAEICKKFGTCMVFGVGRGGKLQSSSWLVKKAQKHLAKKDKPA